MRHGAALGALVAALAVAAPAAAEDDVARFYASVMRPGRRYDLVPTQANGQLAFGAYLGAPTGGIRHGAGLLVLALTGDLISGLVRFDNSVLPWFGLPRSLPG